MPKLPNAPDLDRLRQLSPSLASIPAGTVVHRIYRRGGDHPTLWDAFRYFGPTSARFDHQLRDTDGKSHVQDRGVIYAATDIVTALAEVFQQKRTINRELDQPCLVSAALACELSLLDLTDTFAVRVGGSMKLASGATLYSQNWSRAFYECYPTIHGLYYPSSLSNRPVMALYERALPLRPFEEAPRFHRALRDALLLEPLRNASREIGYDLI
ncbi:MAG: RES family NAD+ phosphorylase [Pseudomonadales bacterium]